MGRERWRCPNDCTSFSLSTKKNIAQFASSSEGPELFETMFEHPAQPQENMLLNFFNTPTFLQAVVLVSILKANSPT